MSVWKAAVLKARKDSAKAPEGAMTMEQIADEMGMRREHARKEVMQLVKLGRAEVVPGQLVTVTGALVNTNYYRLLPADTPLKKPKKK